MLTKVEEACLTPSNLISTTQYLRYSFQVSQKYKSRHFLTWSCKIIHILVKCCYSHGIIQKTHGYYQISASSSQSSYRLMNLQCVLTIPFVWILMFLFEILKHKHYKIQI